jgi:outer membrane protein insertion porin family
MLVILAWPVYLCTQNDEYIDETDEVPLVSNYSQTIITPRIINDIIIQGNHQVTQEAILQAIPYRVGEPFTADRTAQLIKNVYNIGDFPYGIGYFKNVSVKIENIPDNKLNLYVVVDEKDVLEEVRLQGNRAVSFADADKKLELKKLKAIDEHDLGKLIAILKGLYRERSYHHTTIEADLEKSDRKVSAVFNITEGKRTMVKRVHFVGNHNVPSKLLRGTTFTREEWVLGFLDKAGMYQPEAVEADKHSIENFYHNHGFLHARVPKAEVKNCDENHLEVTFYVEEGDVFFISDVHAPGNDILCEEELLKYIPIVPGMLYSKERIREAMENLRLAWGEFGYINADIEPSIQPDEDTKTVSISFYSELGSEVRLNRINIIGNTKTRDKVIRRQLTLEEGDLLTTRKMDQSKQNVELLGYFDQRDGVNWKMNRIDKRLTDLDLIVHEIKTGKFFTQLGFGGSPTDITSPATTVTLSATLADTNLFGLGIHMNLSGQIARDRHEFVFNITEPWLFDRPVHASFDAFYKGSTYTEFTQVKNNDILETNIGGGFGAGLLSERLYDTHLNFNLAANSIRYSERPVPKMSGLSLAEQVEFARILAKRFTPGAFLSFQGIANQDKRNHPMHPSQGLQWELISKVVVPTDASNFGFFKLDADYSWYTPIIGERDLVFCFHTHFGYVVGFKNKEIPFRELYNLGGPASVRGFLFSEISPTWKGTEPLGGTKAFWMNAELIFPITGDFSMKGAFFYDGGSSWDTPDGSEISPKRLLNDGFSFRHAVGFGVRLLQPTPVKIDWGFKLDRRKGESASQVHFSMYHNF